MNNRTYCVIVCTISCAVLSFFCFIETMDYVKARNTRLLYTNTTCAVVNFTCIEQQCKSCDSTPRTKCTVYLCWDEYYSISYSIWNGTKVTSTVGSDRHRQCKQQRQIGRYYTCFYHQLKVDHVGWDMPDDGNWIGLGIPFVMLGPAIIVCVLFYIYDRVKEARANTYCRAQQDVGL